MRRTFYPVVAIVLALCQIAAAQIKVEKTYKPYSPIVASLASSIAPEGAKVRGSWTVANGSFILGAEPSTIHIWAGPGPHEIRAFGIWVLTKDVAIGETTIQELVDFGQYDFTTVFTVTDKPPVPPGPTPPDPTPPDPVIDEAPFPSPDGLRLLILEEATARGSLPPGQQVIIFGSEGRRLLASSTVSNQSTGGYAIWDDDFSPIDLGKVSPLWKAAYAAAKKDAGVNVPWIVVANGKKGFSGPLPKDIAELRALLEGLK